MQTTSGMSATAVVGAAVVGAGADSIVRAVGFVEGVVAANPLVATSSFSSPMEATMPAITSNAANTAPTRMNAPFEEFDFPGGSGAGLDVHALAGGIVGGEATWADDGSVPGFASGGYHLPSDAIHQPSPPL